MSCVIHEDTLKVKVLRYLSEIPISLSVLYFIWQLWWLSGWVVSDSCDSRDCSRLVPLSLVHGTSQARMLKLVAISFSRGSSRPRIEPEPPALQVDSLLTESPERKRLRAAGMCVSQFNWFAACWAYDSFWRKGIFQEGQEGIFFTLEWCSRNDSKATATNGRMSWLISNVCCGSGMENKGMQATYLQPQVRFVMMYN